jgi:hypothetical protein
MPVRRKPCALLRFEGKNECACVQWQRQQRFRQCALAALSITAPIVVKIDAISVTSTRYSVSVSTPLDSERSISGLVTGRNIALTLHAPHENQSRP